MVAPKESEARARGSRRAVPLSRVAARAAPGCRRSQAGPIGFPVRLRSAGHGRYGRGSTPDWPRPGCRPASPAPDARSWRGSGSPVHRQDDVRRLIAPDHEAAARRHRVRPDWPASMTSSMAGANAIACARLPKPRCFKVAVPPSVGVDCPGDSRDAPSTPSGPAAAVERAVARRDIRLADLPAYVPLTNRPTAAERPCRNSAKEGPPTCPDVPPVPPHSAACLSPSALIVAGCSSPASSYAGPVLGSGAPASGGVPGAAPPPSPAPPGSTPAAGIHKIQHVIVIMQENRSFDTYFGTYPGRRRHPDANGVPDGLRARSQPRAAASRPYHDHDDVERRAGRTAQADATADIDGGKMDGFVAPGASTRRQGCVDRSNPGCARHGRARRDGLPRPSARSRTTGPTPATSCCRTTCSSRTRRGACRRTCSWSRAGRPTAPSPATR